MQNYAQIGDIDHYFLHNMFIFTVNIDIIQGVPRNMTIGEWF